MFLTADFEPAHSDDQIIVDYQRKRKLALPSA